MRLITEQAQYRLVDRMWHSWNVDRLYVAGVQIRDRQHAGLNHQKSVIIYDQDTAPGDQTLAIFGSSNWTSPSASGQVEHNMFTTRSDLITWFIDQFNRKWNNLALLARNQGCSRRFRRTHRKTRCPPTARPGPPRSRRCHGWAGPGPISTMSMSALTSTR